MHKFFNRTVPFAAVFVLSCTLIVNILGFLDYSCTALDTYGGINFHRLFYTFITSACTFIVGLCFYFFIRNRGKTNKLRFKYIYWSALPLFVLFLPEYNAIGDLRYRNEQDAICKKSTDSNSMKAQSHNLTLKEYEYIKTFMAVRIPDLPRTAKQIDLSYYADDFLGEFMLDISFTCNIKEKITRDENWGILSIDKPHSTQRVNYAAHAD